MYERSYFLTVKMLAIVMMTGGFLLGIVFFYALCLSTGTTAMAIASSICSLTLLVSGRILWFFYSCWKKEQR